MPEPLTKQEVDSKTDPSVAKQWDTEVSSEDKWKDFYAIADGSKVCMMGTLRDGTGPVGRAMAIAKRTGPDFLFLANAHSQKFDDIEKNKVTNLYFHNQSNQDWISVTGHTVTSSNDDPRIKEVWSKQAAIWFGDLGDGVHTSGPEDPRMKLIEVQPTYISYWKHTAGALGMAKEMGSALITGNVPQMGLLRHMKEDEIKEARQREGDLSSK